MGATEEEVAAAQAAVEAAQSAADQAKSEAQAAQSTADTAKNNATLAQQAADAAKDTADAAQEAADQAQEAADQAQAAVDALAVRVTEAETNILQNAEAVEINASKTEEIETNLANNYYNKTETDAKIKVESDRIAQTVTKVETDLNNLEIGGRNLLLNSSFNDDINKWETKGDLVTSLVRYKGKSCIKIDGNIGIYDYLRQSVLDKLSPDTEYTASAWVLTENIVEGSTDPSLWWCYHSGEYGDNAAPFSYGCADFPVNNQAWEHVTWTFTTDDKTESATESYIYVYVGDVTGQVYISNLKLGCGIANLPKLIENNINVSLGTDGQGSGCSLDMFDTMKFVGLLQKGINENPTLIPAYDVLQMATINGARALNKDSLIGSIVEGKLADLIILDLSNITLQPINDVFSDIVYNAKGTNVITTIVNGKILMENRKLLTIDETSIIKNCQNIFNNTF